MDYPGMYEAPRSVQETGAPRGPRTGLFVALGIAVLLIVLVIYGAVSLFHATKANVSAATDVGSRFVAAMGAHNYQAAFGLCNPAMQAVMSQKKLRSIETTVEQNHGSYLSAGSPAWYVQNNNGQVWVRLTYPARYSNGPVTVALILDKGDDGYQVYSFNYSL